MLSVLSTRDNNNNKVGERKRFTVMAMFLALMVVTV